MTRTRLRRLWSRLREERGQSIVEWLGGTAVMVVIVVGLATVKPSFGEQLRCAVGAQIDRIMTIDQKGDCNIDKPKLPRTHAAPRVSEQDRLDREALRPTTR
jgi:hypothetical protein